MQIAQRMDSLPAHFFAALSARLSAMQSEGLDVIRLDEGSPDLPPAPHIIEALKRSAEVASHHSYQPHRGPQKLRQAWAKMYQGAYHVELDPETEVLPLLGSKEGIFHLAMATLNPGDTVLVPDPGYITYSRGALFAGGRVVSFPLLPERGYLPDLDTIPRENLRRAKMLWLNYPNNPTGGIATLEFFTEAVRYAHKHDLLVCHDAAYTQVTFDGYRAPSLLEVPGAKQVGIEFNTLSKSHNMAGWRVAAATGNPQVLRNLYTLKTNQDSSHFLPVLDAAAEAMSGDQSWLAGRNEVYRQRRDAAMRGIHALGLQADVPCASLYIWCKVPQGWSSGDFVAGALEKARVSMTPGTVFGKNGEGYIRISITTPVERVDEAFFRLKEWLGK